MRGEELLAGGIFLGIYALIVTEKIHRTLAALLGASLVILLKLVDQREAFAFVDFNVIFLLAGMMIIANVMAKTGIFQWIAVEAVPFVGEVLLPSIEVTVTCSVSDPTYSVATV